MFRESSRKRKYIAVKDSGRSSPISSESPTSSYRSNHSESDVTLDSYNSDASCDCNGSCRCGVAVRRHHHRRPSSRYSQKKSHLSKSRYGKKLLHKAFNRLVLSFTDRVFGLIYHIFAAVSCAFS